MKSERDICTFIGTNSRATAAAVTKVMGPVVPIDLV